VYLQAPHSWGFLFVGRWVDLDMVRYISLLLFIGLIWGQLSYHTLTETSRDSEDLIGQWLYENFVINMHITSGIDQTFPSFNQRSGLEPASGSINISGEISGQMNYMYSMMLIPYYYYESPSIFLSNNPIEGGLFSESDDLDFPSYQFMFMSDGDTAVCELFVLDTIAGDTVASNWFSSDASDHITIDTTSYMVSINDLYLTNTNTDSWVLISGSLFAEFIEIVAGEPYILTSLPSPDVNPDIAWEFFDNGTGIRILEHWDNFYDYSWLDTLQFDWDANDDSVTINYGSTPFSQAYVITNDTLYMSKTYIPCEENLFLDCDDYLDFMSMLLEIDDIQEVLQEQISVLTNMNSLSMNKSHIFPSGVNLHQNYPNPFNPVTTLRYDLPEDAVVNITIHDMMGRVVKTLVNGPQTAGYRSIQWNATNDNNRPVSAGLYLYTIQAGEFRQTKKMVLLK